jgi:DNA invertase Pin-like site-specific DNA recombinase
MPAYFAYYRVSTKQQGASGLGLEAQQAAVVSFLKGGQPQGEYVEVESGKKNQRPQLLAAMAAARAAGGVLLIANLDRLSRNASFIFTLRDSGVDFVCCDMPDANTLTVGLFAVLAQHERETISKRARGQKSARRSIGHAGQPNGGGSGTEPARAARPPAATPRSAANGGFYCVQPGAEGELSPISGGVECARLYGPAWGTFNQKQVQRLHERLAVTA